MGPWKGIRFGGTKEPVELYHLDEDIGETRDVAARLPDIAERIKAIMEEARANSAYGKYWPLAQNRLNQIQWDKIVFDQLEHGIRQPDEKSSPHHHVSRRPACRRPGAPGAGTKPTRPIPEPPDDGTIAASLKGEFPIISCG